ncbi:ABC-F family ATP-binding cassette domain-containing protein [Arsenicicoccus dermatophilus]|uniref:ABC-F family ATP-binding cassette domain-containing protein n=1 Tax=Arsenicicoccus dermatophilus TaxID=1076331 RepID=UPI001F4CBE7A|nr:ABC-F family ATP-binding cassette domain-containing protein [Arsenicicoccus dermatophilus]MCH8612543.1 ATP-binding cassette domain-containing protein [Arsenicicoccus dermatophilus]
MPAPLHTSAASGADHLRLDGVSHSYPHRRVLTDVFLVVSSGEIACLIGENGSGKSTLLRIGAGLLVPDAGVVTAPGGVGLYHQEPPYPRHLSVAEVLEDGTAPVRALAALVEREGQALADGDAQAAGRLDAALVAAERHHAWDLDHRVDRVVEGLGLRAIPRDRRANELSGGQVSRLSLAWLLLRAPDTLLLDEPTNHLDAAATELLAELLRGWSGPVVMASHDRAFIDEVATVLVDLDPAPVAHAVVAGDADSPGSGHGVTRFGGSYTDYLQRRREERARWVLRHRDEQAELRRLRERVRLDQRVGNPERGPRTEGRGAKKFYADRNAKVVARRVDDAATALERLEREQVRRPPAALSFRGFREAGSVRLDGPVLVASQVAVAGRLAPISLAVGARSRVLVTGGNGSGKSTLLAVLAGALVPTSGSVTCEARVRVGLLRQDPTSPGRSDPPGLIEQADPTIGGRSGVTVREAYAAAVGPELAQEVPLSALGLVAGRDLDRPVAALSVGQRRRLDLAVLVADPPDVLLLDEPTNHLSLLLVTALERALPDYPGAVVVASHDRWLRAGWSGEQLDLC